MDGTGAQELIARYGTLISLYSELETVSNELNASLENGAQVHSLTDHLKRNMAVAERIREESGAIKGLKEKLTRTSALTGEDRERIRQAEEELTALVNRVVEQDNRIRDLMSRQGVKISRR